MRLLTILAAVVGVLSLFANITLGYTTYSLNMQKNTLQERLNAQIVTYNKTMESLKSTKQLLLQTTAQLAAEEETVSALNAQLESANSSLNNYRDRASRAEYFVNRAKCSYMVDENKAYAANTNNSIKSAIIQTLESVYRGSVQSSSFTTYWTNSKSALLTAFWGDSSTKTVLSWDYNDNLKTIYDVNSGCVMYTR
jgi:hypothetical protein